MWGYGWDMSVSWLFGLLLIAGIVLLVLLTVRVFGRGSSRSEGPSAAAPVTGPSRARQILDERFATGELTAEQYREQIRVLNENP
ncbi:putative membrane protein [Mycetocola sp. 2940]